MQWGIYGILIIVGAFFLLLIFNPNLSCFGKVISSPLYPIFRKKKQKKIKTQDYDFHLVDEPKKYNFKNKKNQSNVKTEDYGFNLVGDKDKSSYEKDKKQKEES